MMNRLPKIANYCYNELQRGRIINIYRPLIDITGDFNAAVYLSQIIYWYRKGVCISQNNGYIYKSVNEMFEETGLTSKMQTRCKNILKSTQLTETYQQNIFGKGSKSFVKLNTEIFLQRICDYYHIDPNIAEITHENWKIGDHPVLRRLYSDRFAYHRDLVYCLGTIESATMLSFLLNRCAMEQKNYKSYTIEDWKRVLGLSKNVQSHSRLLLKELGLIVEKQPIPNNARIFTFPQFDTILEKLEHLSEYKDNPQQSLQLSKLRHRDTEQPKSATLEYPNRQGRDTEQPKSATLEYPNRQEYKEEITFKDYNSYSPYTPPKSISVVFGGGGVFSSNTFSTNNIRQPENLTSTSNQSLPEKTNHSGNLKIEDMDKLIYPSCLRQKDNQPPQTLKQAIYNTVHTLLSDATVEEVQELLDEMAERKNIANPLAYFQELCRRKKDGVLLLCNAPQIQAKRQKTNKIKQAEKQEEQAEKLVSEMSDDELLEKYERYKNTAIKNVKLPAMQGFFVELFVGFIQEIAREYLNRHHETIRDIAHLRTQIIEHYGDKLSDKLKNMINTPEFGFQAV